jgi:hypothetical protein
VVLAVLAELLRCWVEGELFPHEESALLLLHDRWEQYRVALEGRSGTGMTGCRPCRASPS